MKIKELRTAKKLSQKQMAIDLDIRPNLLSMYESGAIKCIPPEMLIKIANYFNVSVDYLIENKANTFELGTLTVAQRELLAKIKTLSDEDIHKLEGVMETLALIKKEDIEKNISPAQKELINKAQHLSDREIARILGYVESMEENSVVRKLYQNEE